MVKQSFTLSSIRKYQKNDIPIIQENQNLKPKFLSSLHFLRNQPEQNTLNQIYLPKVQKHKAKLQSTAFIFELYSIH